MIGAEAEAFSQYFKLSPTGSQELILLSFEQITELGQAIGVANEYFAIRHVEENINMSFVRFFIVTPKMIVNYLDCSVLLCDASLSVHVI